MSLSELISFVGRQSTWGRWVGTLIIGNFLGTWTYLSLKKGEMLPLDLATASLLTVVFITQAIKGQPPTQPPPSNEDFDRPV